MRNGDRAAIRNRDARSHGQRQWLACLAAVAAVAASGCLQARSDAGDASARGEDDYAVYSAVLERSELKRSSTRYVIQQETLAGQPLTSELGREFSGAEQEALDDLLSRAAIELEPRFTVSCAVEVVPGDELNRILTSESDAGTPWDVFEREYPGAFGAFSVSRVGYDHQHTRAMVYLSRFCGSLCGEGWLAILEREDGQWTVASVEMLWIS